MSYKSENWKEKLEQVRSRGSNPVKEQPDLKEETKKLDPIEEEIASILNEIAEADEVSEGKAKFTPRELDKLSKNMKLHSIQRTILFDYVNKGLLNQIFGGKAAEQVEEEVEEEKLSLEKTVEKLTEKNMLGRLSKSLRLNEEGKDKLFNYFEKGELNQNE
jgi:hypothetical protein